MSEGIRQLKQKGLVKFGLNNEIIIPASLDQQASFMEESNAEDRAALETEIQNQQLERNAMDQERQRAS